MYCRIRTVTKKKTATITSSCHVYEATWSNLYLNKLRRSHTIINHEMVSLTIKKPVPKLVEFHSVKKNKDSRITVTS